MAGRPLVKKRRTVFWISIALVCATIGATLLLANDMRNLRSVLRHFGIVSPIEEQPQTEAPAQTLPAPKHPKTARMPAAPAVPEAHLRADFYEAEKSEILGSFLRQIYISGTDLCALLNDAGFLNTGWQTSQFIPDTAACFSERKLAATNPLAQGSLFVSIKGSPDGFIDAIRMKIFWLGDADGQTLKQELIQALKLAIDRTHWSDLEEAVTRIEELDVVELGGFGANLTFKMEDGDPDSHSYILTLTLDSRDPAQLRTRSYFARSNWMPLPDMFTTAWESSL